MKEGFIMDKVIYNISHGMYVLTTESGGCIVDAVSQVGGGSEPLISVAIMKKTIQMNYFIITLDVAYL